LYAQFSVTDTKLSVDYDMPFM